MKNRKFSTRTSFILLILIFTSCKRIVEVDPPKTQLPSNIVFTNDATATSAILGIYSKMMESTTLNMFPHGACTIFGAFSSDELNFYANNSPSFSEIEANNIATNNSEVANFWEQAYKFIYYSNSIIEGLSSSIGVTESTKKQIMGEAKFLRAFCHFYLVNLFDDVPLITTTDYRINSKVSRTSKNDVYQQILNDLKDAQNYLSSDFSFSSGERIRPNKWVATALLARCYLYINDWVNAETQSTDLINNNTFTLVSDLNNIFLKNNSEAIWQLMPVGPRNNNTQEGLWFIPSSTTAKPNAIIKDSLLQSFEPGDQRKVKWIKSGTYQGQSYSSPYKYKVRASGTNLNSTEYYTVFRLAEQYLIRAEARAQQNNIFGAQMDLNTIRNRAGLPNTISNEKSSLLFAIERERRIELCFEFGHRWFDLKRTNRTDANLSILKTPNWQSTDVLYPIPQSERGKNLNLTQNPGY